MDDVFPCACPIGRFPTTSYGHHHHPLLFLRKVVYKRRLPQQGKGLAFI